VESDTVAFDSVQVIRESTSALCCLIMEREYWFAPECLLAGSTVAHFGDRGVIILARRVAEDRGLTSYQHRPLRQ